MLKEVKCNLCNSIQYDILYRGNGLRNHYDKEMYYPTSSHLAFENIVRCCNCNLVYINPQLGSDTIERFYSEGRDNEYIAHINERIETFRRAIDEIERFVKKGRLLDIGCGAGFLLYAARKRGWDVKGIEPNNYFVDFGKKRFGLDILNKSIDEAEFPESYFDVIILWDTLEHLTDPYECLSKAYRWLKRGGYIFINTPNIDSIFAKIFKGKWWFIKPMHLYYFTPRTLNRYLEKNGFRLIQVRPYYQTLKLIYLASKLKVYFDVISRALVRFLTILRLKDLKFTYYAGQMTVVAQKEG